MTNYNRAAQVPELHQRRRLADSVIDDVLERMDYLCGQVNGLSDSQAKTLELVQKHISDSDAWRKRTDEAVAENTAVTEGVRDAVKAGRIVTAVVRWAGYIAAAGAALWTAVYMATHGGSPPGGGISP
ncbi:MAG: hypothetical protein RL682_177 [Pseudomonadota bacterium]|jgi:hypothetical protein